MTKSTKDRLERRKNKALLDKAEKTLKVTQAQIKAMKKRLAGK